MATIATLAVKLVADARELQEGLGRASVGLKEFGSKATALGKDLSTRLTLPIAAVGAAAVKMAADAEEAGSKFGVVFGDQADAVRRQLEALTATIPATQAELQGMAAGIQDLLVPLGIVPEAASDMTTQIVRLAGDLASFNNIPMAEALERIRSGLVGQYEPLLSFGVALSAATVEARALEMGLIAEGERLDAAARAAASFSLILEGTTAAHGDAARTAESAANSMRFLWQQVKELAISFGNELLPVVTPFIQRATDMVRWLNEMSPAMKTAAIVVAGLVAAIGPLLVALGAVSTGLGVVAAALASPLLAPIAAVGAAVAGLVTVWLNFRDEITVFARVTERVIKRWADTSGASIVELARTIRTMFVDRLKQVVDFVKEWAGRIVEFFRWMGNLIGRELVPDLTALVEEEWASLGNNMVDTTEETTEAVVQSVEDMAYGVDAAVTSMSAGREFERMVEKMEVDAELATTAVQGEFVGLREELPLPEIEADVVDAFDHIAATMTGKVGQAAGEVLDAMRDLGINLPPEVDAVVGSIGKITGTLQTLLDTDFASIGQSLLSVFETVANALPGIVDTILGLINKIGGAFSFGQGNQVVTFQPGGGGGAPPAGTVVAPDGSLFALQFEMRDFREAFNLAATNSQAIELDQLNELKIVNTQLALMVASMTQLPLPPGSSGSVAGTSGRQSIDAINRELGIQTERDNLALGLL